jgi:DNA-directed RNA polymerase specialized sigma subunit
MYYVWFDDSNKSLERKISEAQKNYQQKYGKPATECLISEKVAELPKIEGIEVGSAKNIPLHNFWLKCD